MFSSLVKKEVFSALARPLMGAEGFVVELTGTANTAAIGDVNKPALVRIKHPAYE